MVATVTSCRIVFVRFRAPLPASQSNQYTQFPLSRSDGKNRRWKLEFRVITNDGSQENNVYLTPKHLFHDNLPKMPKGIVRLVFDQHKSMVILKEGWVVVASASVRTI
jgi:hypothetical protein